MKNIYKTLSLCLFGLLSPVVLAQPGVKRAAKDFDQYAYIDAIKIYEKVVKRGHSSAQIYSELGDANYFNGNYNEAARWYGELFAQYPDQVTQSAYYYRYAQSLKSTGDDASAEQYLEQFVQKAGSESASAALIQKERDYKKGIEKNSGRYTIENLSINSPYSDYGSSIHNGKLLFTTARDTGSLSKKVHSWTDKAFTSIYSASLHSDGSVTDATRFDKGICSKFNEATPVVTKDGKTMYFTRNNYNGKRGYDEHKTTLLKIYKATFRDGKWGDVEELPFNSDAFNTAHPVLNDKEDMMYFASDRPGGFGASDIWRIALHPNGTFGGPENLGPHINTEGRENFPFVTANDELYFSSDGRPGLGGLDVFGVKIKDGGAFGEVMNVGTPVNSAYDDFAYMIDMSTQRGFFSSNRPGGKGSDDIYGFTQTRALELDCVQRLRVRVMDAATQEVITTATVDLYSGTYEEYGSGKGSQNGVYAFTHEFECGMPYRIKAAAKGYVTKEDLVVLPQTSSETVHTIALSKEKVKVEKGDDLFKIFKLNPIYFDLDKHDIRSDAATELAKIVEVMKEYPQMKIDVRSHTDSRGSDSYNMKLSQRRAKSTADWMVAQGVDRNRITYKGYGETQLINACVNGAKCTDAEHEENRRSEFIVVEM
ncbi:OmpA family protein [Paenimyroides ceti]